MRFLMREQSGCFKKSTRSSNPGVAYHSRAWDRRNLSKAGWSLNAGVDSIDSPVTMPTLELARDWWKVPTNEQEGGGP